MRVTTAGALGALMVFALTAPGMLLAQPVLLRPADRRDELARVQEALSDPDPLQRQANMEAIVKRGDPLETRTAIRTAFASDDGELRSMAMQAVLSTIGEITFDLALPPEIQRDYDRSRTDHSDGREFGRSHRYIERLLQGSFKLHLRIVDYSFPQAGGQVESLERRPAAFVIKSGAFSSSLTTEYGRCYVDFAPTAKPLFVGTLECAGYPRLAMTAVPF